MGATHKPNHVSLHQIIRNCSSAVPFQVRMFVFNTVPIITLYIANDYSNIWYSISSAWFIRYYNINLFLYYTLHKYIFNYDYSGSVVVAC